ncbi:MAG: SUMF1/EgtB/PvdO family nonheme iron enzyme [Gammaproteobacteria bacterium]|nr:SUMF1/EgtB/PvdO family nonheme iron enzyme [Gammaproteobacteria bacterium]
MSRRARWIGWAWLAVVLAAISGLPNVAAAERVALVVGNSRYQHAPHLSNPAHDAKAVAEALTDLGFAVTGPLYDLNKVQLDAALGTFGDRAHTAEAVVVFFAGHGLEARGQNYLIPVDAQLERETSASLEAVALDVVLDQIAGPRGYRLVILDACRDNPLANRMQRRDGTRAVYRGFKRVEPEGQTYVAYAAKDGTRARDDSGAGHSPFTAALLKYLKEPLPLPNLFGAVREDVLEATQQQQEPWLYGAFGRHPVYLTSNTAPIPPSPPAVAQASVPSPFRPSVPNEAPVAESRPAAGQVFQDTLSDGTRGPKMVVIPAGEFWMGSPDNETGRENDERQHRVAVSAFAVGQTEVTFAEYDQFCAATGRDKPDYAGWWGRGTRPAINVSWNDAVAYAKWLSRETGQPYRLPTEAEWEYAARAGTATPFWTGDCVNTDQANYDGHYGYGTPDCGAETGVYRKEILPVGSFKPNPWGLYDTMGNVWEWTCSMYNKDYNGAEKECFIKDTVGPLAVRGGSWLLGPARVRSADRVWFAPTDRYGNLGFRLARSL